MKAAIFFMIAIALLALATIASAELQLSARALKDEVLNLPDAPADGPRQFSGYIPVANSTTQIFYWFILAKDAPETKPVVWTTNGGPGCSGLLGLLNEWGLYQPYRNAETGRVHLQERVHSWNEHYNMIFVEQPVPGFSYAQAGTTPWWWTNKQAAERNADFIEGFFERFPAFKPNTFVINSESFGGVYIPSLTQELVNGMETPRFSWLNFKLALIGNPLIYLRARDFGYYATLIQHKVVPYYPYGERYLALCAPDKSSQPYPPPALPAECDNLERQMSKFHPAIDNYAVSYPICVDTRKNELRSSSQYGIHFLQAIAKAQRAMGKTFTAIDVLEEHNNFFAELFAQDGKKVETFDELLEQILQTGSVKYDPNNQYYFPPNYQACEDDYIDEYLNRKDVQNAIHAQLKGKSRWSQCSSCPWSDADFGSSTLPYYKYNHAKNPKVRTVVMSGTNDLMCSTTESEMSFFNNGFTMKSQKVLMSDKGQQIGTETVFDELTFVTVLAAGHMIPTTKPYHSLFLAKRYIGEADKN